MIVLLAMFSRAAAQLLKDRHAIAAWLSAASSSLVILWHSCGIRLVCTLQRRDSANFHHCSSGIFVAFDSFALCSAEIQQTFIIVLQVSCAFRAHDFFRNTPHMQTIFRYQPSCDRQTDGRAEFSPDINTRALVCWHTIITNFTNYSTEWRCEWKIKFQTFISLKLFHKFCWLVTCTAWHATWFFKLKRLEVRLMTIFVTIKVSVFLRHFQLGRN